MSRLEPTTIRPATRLWLVLALLVATAAAGAAAHRRGAVEQAPPGALAFQAPGPGPVHFSGQLDRGALAVGSDGLARLELVIRADELPGDGHRVPTDLVVVLDRSGSMQGAPLVHAKAAVRELVAGLGPRDRFALVAYASGAGLIAPLAEATSSARAEWLRSLEAIHANGGTNMARGIELGVAQLAARTGRAARVVLLSDGHANEGDFSPGGLRARVQRGVRHEAIVSTVGLGDGFNESLMTSLADAGAGNFYYVRHAGELAGVFEDEFASASQTVASALQVVIEPRPGVQVVDAAGYPLEHAGGRVSFRPGTLFGGQERRIWVTLRAPTAQAGSIPLAAVRLTYRSDGELYERSFAETPTLACLADEAEAEASVDVGAWARSVVVDETNALKQKVSSYLQAGRADEARRELDAFVQEKKRENAVRQQAPVTESIAEAEELYDAVQSAASPSARNRLSKELSAEGYDGRRVGAKYAN
jgi:Ca-activated chloride channel family protein